MARVPFSKLGLKLNNNPFEITFNDQNVEIKRYLSIQEKLNIIGNALRLEAEYNNNNFVNIPMLRMFTELEIIYAYTNLSFTEKQKEDFIKTYDLLNSNHFIENLYSHISNEFDYIMENTIRSAELSYSYNNSVYGILDALQTDYNGLNFNAAEIQQKLADPENMDLLKQVLTKLG